MIVSKTRMIDSFLAQITDKNMDFLQLFGLILFGIVGSTLINYLADVLPTQRKLGAARCAHCERNRLFDDYVLLKQCRLCTEKPPRRHLILLIVMPCLMVLLAFFNDQGINIWLSALLIHYFALIVVIDIEHKLILHMTTIFGLLLTGLAGILRNGFWITFFGALAGFAIMFIFYLLGILFIKHLNKKREEPIDEVALGFGDVTISTVLGALLGWPAIIGGIFVGIFLGGIISALVLIIGFLNKEQKALYALPYGPFLVISSVLLLYAI